MNQNDPIAVSPSGAAHSRRSFLKKAGFAGAATAALTSGVSLFTSASRAFGATTVPLDLSILNFALNLEYLEAQYYWYAVYGKNITTAGVNISGTGTPGDVTIKPNSKVPWTRDRIRQYATEIANDEKNHVNTLRATIAAYGGKPVAQPAINLQQSFTTLAMAAGIITTGQVFDPFISDKNFLLGAFIFEDVGVTAYKGAAALLTDKSILTAAAGFLAVEAYHAGSVRSQLHTLFIQEGFTDIPSTVDKISNLRDVLDGTGDDDQGIVVANTANLVPTDASGLAYSRTTRQVLNVVYGAANASKGLFYPNGMNGDITS